MKHKSTTTHVSRRCRQPEDPRLLEPWRRLVKLTPGLRKLFSRIRTPADWRRHEDRIKSGIVHQSLTEIAELEALSRTFGTPVPEPLAKAKALLRKMQRDLLARKTRDRRAAGPGTE